MSIRRWGDEDGTAVVEVGPSPTWEWIVLIVLILAAAWIVTRPVTAVQHIDQWPEPVAAEVGR